MRAEVAHGEKVSFKKQVRLAETQKVPVVLVVGDKEQEQGLVSVRTYREGELGTRGVEELVETVARCARERVEFLKE